MSAFGPTLLRLVVAAVFLSHGLLKAWPAPAGGGLSDTAALLASVDIRMPHLVAMAWVAVEIGGGVALALGAHTVWTAFALLLATAVTSWTLHLTNGTFLNWALQPWVAQGVEFDLLLVGALLSLMATGPGRLSFDRARGRSAELEAAGRARLRRGRG